MHPLRFLVKTAANRIPTTATIVDYLLFAATHSSFSERIVRHNDLLAEVYEHGFAMVPNYFSAKECEQSIADFHTIAESYPDSVQHYSDRRIYGVELVSPTMARFGLDPLLLSLANQYNQQRTANAFVMVNHVVAAPDSKGSGEGWHKDASFRQFKAFVYLNDVTAESGALQVIERSNKLHEYISDMKSAGLPFRQLRISDQQIDRILQRRPERLKTMVAPAGTLLLVDTASIHRGRPPTCGERYALTNYYMDVQQFNERAADVYRPISRERVDRLFREIRGLG